jgi:hypothetical protein
MVVGAVSKGPMRFNALMRLIDGVSHRNVDTDVARTRARWSREADGLCFASAEGRVRAHREGRFSAKPLSALSE